MLGYGGYVGGVVLGGHGYGTEEETGEGGMLVEDVAALGVDVEEVEGGRGEPGRLAKRASMRRRSSLRTGASKGWKRKARVGVRGRSKVRASCSKRRMGASGEAVVSAA